MYAILLFSLLGLIAGCSQQNASLHQQAHFVPESTQDPASIKLAQAADSVSHSLVELAKIKTTAAQKKSPSLVNPHIVDLQAHTSVDWAGPIEPLLHSIAKSTHYQIRILGKAPIVPVTVAINTKDMPMARIIRQIDYLAGERAFIRVFTGKSKIIEIRYASS